jgi:hypothetical protein
MQKQECVRGVGVSEASAAPPARPSGARQFLGPPRLGANGVGARKLAGEMELPVAR